VAVQSQDPGRLWWRLPSRSTCCGRGSHAHLLSCKPYSSGPCAGLQAVTGKDVLQQGGTHLGCVWGPPAACCPSRLRQFACPAPAVSRLKCHLAVKGSQQPIGCDLSLPLRGAGGGYVWRAANPMFRVCRGRTQRVLFPSCPHANDAGVEPGARAAWPGAYMLLCQGGAACFAACLLQQRCGWCGASPRSHLYC